MNISKYLYMFIFFRYQLAVQHLRIEHIYTYRYLYMFRCVTKTVQHLCPEKHINTLFYVRRNAQNVQKVLKNA